MSDIKLLRELQRNAFCYFLDEYNDDNGMYYDSPRKIRRNARLARDLAFRAYRLVSKTPIARRISPPRAY